MLPEWVDPTATINSAKKIYLKLFVQKRDKEFNRKYAELASEFRKTEGVRRVTELDQINVISARIAHQKYLQQRRGSALTKAAEDWHKANLIRLFIAACEQQLSATRSSAQEKWLGWAKKYVSTIDPLSNGYLKGSVEELESTGSKG